MINIVINILIFIVALMIYNNIGEIQTTLHEIRDILNNVDEGEKLQKIKDILDIDDYGKRDRDDNKLDGDTDEC